VAVAVAVAVAVGTRLVVPLLDVDVDGDGPPTLDVPALVVRSAPLDDDDDDDDDDDASRDASLVVAGASPLDVSAASTLDVAASTALDVAGTTTTTTVVDAGSGSVVDVDDSELEVVGGADVGGPAVVTKADVLGIRVLLGASASDDVQDEADVLLTAGVDEDDAGSASSDVTGDVGVDVLACDVVAKEGVAASSVSAVVAILAVLVGAGARLVVAASRAEDDVVRASAAAAVLCDALVDACPALPAVVLPGSGVVLGADDDDDDDDDVGSEPSVLLVGCVRVVAAIAFEVGAVASDAVGG